MHDDTTIGCYEYSHVRDSKSSIEHANKQPVNANSRQSFKYLHIHKIFKYLEVKSKELCVTRPGVLTNYIN